jgi:hypothetical protein
MYIGSEDIDAQVHWSRRTFGPGKREQGIIDHIKKELKEIEQAETEEEKFEEWIDIIILGIDGAWRAVGDGYGSFKGLKIIKGYLAKMDKNMNKRKWPDWRTAPDPQGQPIEHVRNTDVQ